jgi:NADH-quinone oxidoreductase subunit L
MATALIVLALGSIVAGWVGIPHALHGNNRIEAFLEPSFEAHAMAPATEFQVTEGRVGAPAAPEAAADAHAAPAASEETELLLMGISTGLALAGIGLAWYFWRRNLPAAESLARSFRPIHTLLLNKYYVDELYDGLVVRPLKAGSVALWKGADAVLIDGSVNGVGRAVQGTSAILRQLQSGSVRAYAASLFLGVVMILGWYLLR